MSFPDKAERLLQLIAGWEDPHPAPLLREHDGVLVVRDDLLPYGSKVRFADFLIGHHPDSKGVEEWVYGSSPPCGYAQISLPAICARHGKKAVIFMAKRALSRLHPYQKRGLELGAEYMWVPNGMLRVTQCKAASYVKENQEKRRLLPMGLDHPTVLASVIQVARSLGVAPREVWSAGSSGTLSRGLQLAFPDAEVHVVSVGHCMSRDEIGRAVHHRCAMRFDQEVKEKDRPPFPSAANYDAKVWALMRAYHTLYPPKGTVLLWNVGA